MLININPRKTARELTCLSPRPLAYAVACALLSSAHAQTPPVLPSGGQVVAGQATINAPSGINGNTLLIQQQSQNAAINWQSFNIGAGAAVNFAQPSASSITLNRVLGQNPSSILGNLTANGQIFILNPNGVLFGKGAQVNVGGLIASTLSLSNENFMAGRYAFFTPPPSGGVGGEGQCRQRG